MMVEIWWKVFLFGLVIAGVLKLLGNSTNFAVLFLSSSALVLVFFAVAIAVHNMWRQKRSK
jgi:hypothetical protein